MRKLAVAAALVSGVLATSVSATTFLFTYSGAQGLNGASGTLQATDNGNGTFNATSGTIVGFGPSYADGTAGATGTLIANPIAPATATSASGAFVYDNQLTPPLANPTISNGGLLFSVGGYEVNIFSNGPGPGTYSLLSYVNGAYTAEARGDFALTEVGGVPEAATWAMMVAGFGLVGASVRRRKPTVVAA